MPMALRIILIVIGGIFALLGALLFMALRYRNRHYPAKTRGKITESQKKDDGKYYACYEFEHNGEKHFSRDTVGWPEPKYTDGQGVNVRFDPENPILNELEDTSSVRTKLAYALVNGGGIIILIGLLGFLIRC